MWNISACQDRQENRIHRAQCGFLPVLDAIWSTWYKVSIKYNKFSSISISKSFNVPWRQRIMRRERYVLRREELDLDISVRWSARHTERWNLFPLWSSIKIDTAEFLKKYRHWESSSMIICCVRVFIDYFPVSRRRSGLQDEVQKVKWINFQHMIGWGKKKKTWAPLEY